MNVKTNPIDIQNVYNYHAVSEAQIQLWASATLMTAHETGQICIRIVDEAEIQQLNEQYRHKNTPTNVLSFPTNIPSQINLKILGDVIICAPIITKEAVEYGVSETAHFSHMVIHGVLHLLGHDHQEKEDTEKMQTQEIKLLSQFGFANPYEDTEHE